MSVITGLRDKNPTLNLFSRAIIKTTIRCNSSLYRKQFTERCGKQMLKKALNLFEYQQPRTGIEKIMLYRKTVPT